MLISEFKKNSAIFSLIFISAILFICFFPQKTNAQTVETEICEDANFSIIARNDSGSFIPGITVDIYEQIYDADNRPKPGTKITTGKTSTITGIFSGIVKKPDGKRYAIKMNSLGKDATAFWFYDDLILGCGDNKEVTKALSAIEFVIRDATGNLKINEQFSLYAQKYDADNKPIKEKSSLIAALTTGETGKIIAYVPSGADQIDGFGGSYYIFEKLGINGGVYSMYDILVSSGNTTQIEYKISEMKLEMRDINDISFPANSKIEIFVQAEDEDNKSILGEKLKDIYTNDLGNAEFAYPAGIYAARLLGASAIYTYFWDLEIKDQMQTIYLLKTNESWLPEGGACEATSNFALYTRGLDYNLIPNLNFNIYEQEINADGKPYAAKKLSGGKISESGEGKIVINPDPRKKYALQIYEKNEKIGDFWFFDQLQFTCGQNMEITKQLPALNIILRDAGGELIKNQAFSLYTQKYDADDKPVKEKKDLVSDKFNSGETGKTTIYLAANHPYIKEKRGSYALLATNANKVAFTEYDLNTSSLSNLDLEYVFSDLVINYKNAEGKNISEKNIDLYEQSKNANGKYLLGKKIITLKTDAYGTARIEYPSGYYAAVVIDSLGQKNIFWNQPIKNRLRNNVVLNENKTKIYVKDGAGNNLNIAVPVNIYVLKEAQEEFIVEKKFKTMNTAVDGTLAISLAPGPYLFSTVDQKIEYGKALYAENEKIQAVTIKFSSDQKIINGQKYKLNAASALTLAEKMKGRLLLQVEGHGEAWYVDPNSLRRYYAKDGPTAFEMLRKFGLGITNADLNKIPIGLDARFEEWDYDGDQVPDKMEETLGTDMYNYDSDGDGFNDGQELLNGYDPQGSGKLISDQELAKRLSGKILLQTESKGEAWYINPENNRRYYMKDGESAYEIMRFLSLGITNANLEKIEAGSL